MLLLLFDNFKFDNLESLSFNISTVSFFFLIDYILIWLDMSMWNHCCKALAFIDWTFIGSLPSSGHFTFYIQIMSKDLPRVELRISIGQIHVFIQSSLFYYTDYCNYSNFYITFCILIWNLEHHRKVFSKNEEMHKNVYILFNATDC